jgi:hypothetical protein
MPSQVSMAIDRKARLPAVDSLRLKIFRFSGQSLTQGVMNLTVNGVPVRVYSPMKTVADCFKYRNKIGIEIGAEALTAAIKQNKYNRQKLLRFASICRVTKIVNRAADSAERAARPVQGHEARDAAPVWNLKLLREQVWAEPLSRVARKYGVSGVALAKRCKKMGIPLPGRGYWSRRDRS